MNEETTIDETEPFIEPVIKPGDEEVPVGFTVIEENNEDLPKWDFEIDPIMQGKVLNKQQVNVPDGAGTRPVWLISVSVGGEGFIVWQCASLKEWMKECFVGQQVWLKYQGMKELPNKRSMKVFKVATGAQG